jgi:hypothetical protein
MTDDTTTTTTIDTTLGYDIQVSMAISCILAWLIPHLYFEFFEFTEYRIALEKQITESERQGSTTSSTKQKRRRQRNKDATHATVTGAIVALSIIAIAYSVSALVVSWTTQEMDRRADAIVIGMGRIMSAVLFVFFSVKIPQWLDVVDSPQNIHFYQRQVTCSLAELRYRVCRSILSHFFVMYFILLLYFCNAYAIKILRSTAGKLDSKKQQKDESSQPTQDEKVSQLTSSSTFVLPILLINSWCCGRDFRRVHYMVGTTDRVEEV